MADRVWKGVYPKVFGHSKQLALNKFFDPSTPTMSKGDSGRNEEKKRKKTVMRIVATMSLPAVNCPNADRGNAACSCQYISFRAVLYLQITSSNNKCAYIHKNAPLETTILIIN